MSEITDSGNEICVLIIKIEKYQVSNQTKMSHFQSFQPLEVVGRGSETQLQVGVTLASLIRKMKNISNKV